MKRIFLLAAALIVVAILLPLLWSEEQNRRPAEGMPWQIETHADGTSSVFGLTLGHATLEDARNRLGPDMELAVVAAPGEPGTLEAYYSQVSAGAITGKMVLVADADAETVQRLRERAPTSEYMESTTRKFVLDSNDARAALRTRIASITFIPSANFDEATALARFGEPQERMRISDDIEHFLYPQTGLDLALNAKGKEVLQYVAPREFARLRAPLRDTPDSDTGVAR